VSVRLPLVLSVLGSLALLGLAVATVGLAQGSSRFPAWARSALVERATTPRVSPDFDADPRGTIQRDTRLPIGGEVVPTDDTRCRYWLNVAPDAWVCGKDLTPSREAPGGEDYPRIRRDTQLVPYLYGKVNREGAPAWSSEAAVGKAPPSRHYRGRFMLALTGSRRDDVIRTRNDDYVRASDIQLYWPSRFEGVELDGSLAPSEIGWITSLRASVYPSPGERRTDRLMHHTRVVITDATTHEGHYRIEQGGWVSRENVTRPTLLEPPAEVTGDDKWVDVDLDNQVLVAYEGRRPVYATLISSGRQRPDYITPIGTFRIWIKYGMADMDDIGNEDASRDYSADGVPWVQYFEGSIGFHAAYWHNSFGQRMSHGCVNLSPRDARWLYEWTEPHVSPGWVSARPSEHHPGTLVRIREEGERPRPLSASR